ncbi:36007_t:CDS:2, partial [Gigaspora margarita]
MEHGIYFNNNDTNNDISTALAELDDTFFVENSSSENNSNNYIEDKVYDDLKLKVKELFKKGKCTCCSKCLEKIGYERFLAHRIEFESLDKNICDM